MVFNTSRVVKAESVYPCTNLICLISSWLLHLGHMLSIHCRTDAYCIDAMTKHESHHSLSSHRLSTSAPLTAAIFGKLIYSITSYKVPTCSKLNLPRLQSLCTYNLFDCTEEKSLLPWYTYQQVEIRCCCLRTQNLQKHLSVFLLLCRSSLPLYISL